jgi:hypothetical protein
MHSATKYTAGEVIHWRAARQAKGGNNFEGELILGEGRDGGNCCAAKWLKESQQMAENGWTSHNKWLKMAERVTTNGATEWLGIWLGTCL